MAEGERAILDAQQDPNNPDNSVALADSRAVRNGAQPPVPYSPERARRFCELVGSTTMTLRQIGLEVGIHHTLFLAWCGRYDDLAEQYARARERQMHLRADELLEIADNATNDWMAVETRAGRIIRVVDHAHIKRSEVRIRTRQWIMGKFAPKAFGERMQVEVAQETLQSIAAKSDEQRYEEAIALVKQARRRIAEAYKSGEISEAELEDVEDGAKGRDATR
jgi:hypothetical protein